MSLLSTAEAASIRTTLGLLLAHRSANARFRATPATASFGMPVSVVDGPGAKKQVGRIAARRIVATVENAQPQGNGTEGQYPGYLMGQLNETAINGALDTAVAFADSEGPPRPAAIEIVPVNLFPESLFERPAGLGDADAVAAVATELAPTPTDFGLMDLERRAAVAARVNDGRGRLVAHREPPTRGAVPPDVVASRRLLHTNFATSTVAT